MGENPYAAMYAAKIGQSGGGGTNKKRQRNTNNKPKKAEKTKKRKTERPEKKTTRTRDNTHKQAKRAGMKDICVKACFAKRFAHGCPAPQRAYMRTLVDGYVDSISRMSVRGSLVMNEAIHRCFETRVDLPDLRDQTVVRKILTGKSTHTVVVDVMNELFRDHPEIARWKADGQVVTYEAKQFITNFQNHIIGNFDDWLRGFLKGYVKLYHENAPKWWWWGTYVDILELEEDHPHDLLPADLVAFVRTMKTRMTWRGKVDHKSKPSELVGPTYAILRAHYDFKVPGGFTMVPISNVKRRYIQIDSTTLWKMVTHVATKFKKHGHVPKWIRKVAAAKDFTSNTPLQDYAWKRFFDTSRLRKRGRNDTFFNHRIVTDGVGVSVTFLRKRPPRPTGDPETEEEVKRRLFTDYERHAFIDPGRDHLITAYEIDDNGNEVWRSLTRGQYYQSFRRGELQLERWNARLQEVDNQFSETSLKTCDAAMRANYIGVYIKHYGSLWLERGSKRHSRVRFWIMTRKRRCLDRFFASFTRGDRRRLCMWYGSASFSSHGRGSTDGRAVPVKYVFDACKRHYTTMKVDEYLTSQMHSVCKSRMHPVRTRPPNGGDEIPQQAHGRTVRGLYWCPACRCFVHRDRDAARSICHVAVTTERPSYLRRRVGEQKLPARDKLPVANAA